MTVLGLSLLLLAQVATPADIPKGPLYTADHQKVTCKLEWELASRIPIRVCRTDADWERLTKENQDDFGSSRNGRKIGCNPSANSLC